MHTSSHLPPAAPHFAAQGVQGPQSPQGPRGPRGPLGRATDRLDRWLRTAFVEANTELEEAYFAAGAELLTGGPGLARTRQQLAAEGAELITRAAGEDGVPGDPTARYELLGTVGLFLGACRRHEVDGPGSEHAGPLAAAGSFAQSLGTSLGVAPRFVFAHQALYNRAVHGAYRTFTSLPDERTFLTHNGLAVLAYERAAGALRRIPAMGVTNPMAEYLLAQARDSLGDVLRFNQSLAGTLDADRFFCNIRPYSKPYTVGGTEYRGANAGDFAAINEIDLLLGLCTAQDPFYQRLMAEKYPYVPPQDQGLLRNAVTAVPLLGEFLREAESGPVTSRLRTNAGLFLAVCTAHGAAYTYHHNQLVKPFLEKPAAKIPAQRKEGITASGPPLEAVVRGLARLRDLRSARRRPDAPGARPALDRLAELTGAAG